MRETILRQLQDMEHAYDVRVLYSVESGSRAWGMASEDSDYDVRFVYVRPLEDYLRLEKVKDTIEWKLDEVLDITGWDVTKFLQLMRASNPTAFEWVSSPISYREEPEFARIRAVAGRCFSPVASAFHYQGIARENLKLVAGRPTANVKKYLYAIRAVLASRWVLDEKSPAPMLFSDLIAAKLEAGLAPTVDHLLAMKAAGDEHCVIAAMPELAAWVEHEVATLAERARKTEPPEKLDWSVLDGIFRSIVVGA